MLTKTERDQAEATTRMKMRIRVANLGHLSRKDAIRIAGRTLRAMEVFDLAKAEDNRLLDHTAELIADKLLRAHCFKLRVDGFPIRGQYTMFGA